MGSVKMRVFLVLLVTAAAATAAAAFAKGTGEDLSSHQDQPGHEVLDLDSDLDSDLDCPMVNTRIIGAQTDISPGVTNWEECATICAGVPACKYWTLSKMELDTFCYLWSPMDAKSEIPNNTSG